MATVQIRPLQNRSKKVLASQQISDDAGALQRHALAERLVEKNDIANTDIRVVILDSTGTEAESYVMWHTELTQD